MSHVLANTKSINSVFIISVLIIISIVLSVSRVYGQAALEDKKIDRGDFFLHYKQHGQIGDPIIVLAGGPGSSVDYMQPFADSLSASYRCILLEQRGTGRSLMKKYDSSVINMAQYVEDIEAIRKDLKADKLILLGNSWGSMLAFLYGSKFPHHTKAILSIGSCPTSTKYAQIFNDNYRMRLLPDERERRNKWREQLEDSATFVLASYERDRIGLPAYYYDRKIGLFAASQLKVSDFNYYIIEAFDKAHPKFDIQAQLMRITSPTLLVQGRQDLAGEENIIETKRLIKSASLHFVERCGHIPWEEKSVETWILIRQFLETIK